MNSSLHSRTNSRASSILARHAQRLIRLLPALLGTAVFAALPATGNAQSVPQPVWAGAGVPVPPGVPVVEGGSVNNQPAAVCRIVLQGGTYVGRLDGGRCLVGDTAAAREAESGVMQLLYALPSQLRWQGAAGGAVPAGAVAGGLDRGGRALAVCRASHQGAVVPGNVLSNHTPDLYGKGNVFGNGCRIGAAGQGITVAQYEVLIPVATTTTTTAPASVLSAPPKPFVAPTPAGGSGFPRWTSVRPVNGAIPAGIHPLIAGHTRPDPKPLGLPLCRVTGNLVAAGYVQNGRCYAVVNDRVASYVAFEVLDMGVPTTWGTDSPFTTWSQSCSGARVPSEINVSPKELVTTACLVRDRDGGYYPGIVEGGYCKYVNLNGTGRDFHYGVLSHLPAVPRDPNVSCVAGQDVAREVFEDVVDMSDDDMHKVMDWIKVKTTGEKLPFCWRQSDPRGAGTLPGRVADCPATYTNNGLTCGRGADTIGAPSQLANCPSGYTNMGLTCYRGPGTYGKACTTVFKKHACAPGYTDNGCTCGRGADSLGASAMVCPAGYFKSDITQRCHVNCPAGYTNTGETCFKGVSTLGMGAMACKSGESLSGPRCFPTTGNGLCFNNEEVDAGLCYRRCKPGFDGVGPVCWQQCAAGWVNCGAGCAKDKTQCGMTIADQVIAPLMVAANVATFGLAQGASAGVEGAENSVKVGEKMITSNSKVGRLLLKTLDKAQSIKSSSQLVDGATLTRRIWNNKGVLAKAVKTTVKVSATVYDSINDFSDVFAQDFTNQTSKDINQAIDDSFHPRIALLIKQAWGRNQMGEMAVANGWVIAQDVMSWVSMVDITGMTGLVSAYAKPVCQDVLPMPCVSANLKCGK